MSEGQYSSHIFSEGDVQRIIDVFERLQWAAENDNTNGVELTEPEAKLLKELKDSLK